MNENSVAPILRIPTEVLTEIFCHTSGAYLGPDDFWALDDTTCIPDDAVNQMPFRLLQVCRVWYNIVLDTPRLFARVALDEYTPRPYQLLLTHLGRSGAHLMDVWIDVDKIDFIEDDYDDIFHLVRNNFSRIRSLSMPPGCYLADLVPEGTEVHAPALVSLDLSYQATRSGLQTSDVGFLVAPNLKHLKVCLTYETHLLIKMTAGALTKFTNTGFVSHYPALQRLSSEFPHLEELKVIQNTYDDNNNIETGGMLPIRFNSLKRFRFEWEGPSYIPAPPENLATLENIRTPKLECLEFYAMVGVQFSSIRVWLGASNAPIRTLAVKKSQIDGQTLSDLLPHLPHLEELVIEKATLQQEAIELLDRRINPQICPKLIEIVFLKSSISFQSVLNMLTSRLTRTNNIEALLEGFETDINTVVAASDRSQLTFLEESYAGFSVWIDESIYVDSD
ncbi:hypothetical protein M422DRAFT_68411 [Sphaerobolus stellatus SS14]|uniref:F-box domain-containing protein n=1 Tax=Sphaerobolus stellatus (strain SS14) TaxID=990650 RepID=A0A0C9UDK3_SPHS4|nr:hypothetical protein M422DRAFT_68411 [Sphaerobolus stellatus SS14]